MLLMGRTVIENCGWFCVMAGIWYDEIPDHRNLLWRIRDYEYRSG
jgi:hypothetical protein